MPWRGHNATFCKGCGRSRAEAGKMSARYLCQRCGDERMLTQVAQMRSLSGPFFEAWRRQTAASVGAVVVDDLPPEQ